MKRKKDIKKILGEEIAKQRKKNGLTQVDLSLILNTSDRYIGKVENGKTNLGIVNIEKFATALGIKIEDLLKGH